MPGVYVGRGSRSHKHGNSKALNPLFCPSYVCTPLISSHLVSSLSACDSVDCQLDEIWNELGVKSPATLLGDYLVWAML